MTGLLLLIVIRLELPLMLALVTFFLMGDSAEQYSIFVGNKAFVGTEQLPHACIDNRELESCFVAHDEISLFYMIVFVSPSFFFGKLLGGLFSPVWLLEVLWIFPLLRLFSILSPIMTRLEYLDDMLPIILSKYYPCKVFMNISTKYHSESSGCTCVASSLHLWTYSLNVSLFFWV